MRQGILAGLLAIAHSFGVPLNQLTMVKASDGTIRVGRHRNRRRGQSKNTKPRLKGAD